MITGFLDGLEVSDEDRARLASLGAKSPYALLARRKASKDAFDGYIGQDLADSVAIQLDPLLTDEQRESLRQPPKPAGKTGARTDSLVR
jgi:hypothetical protein